ncbi:Sec-independent protein translocase protein TatB [Pusillimonas sp. SM2304]|uniref:Sec-independent protein translocase protein TatB n=1 Tax=Pusillimonas sp. SM2304 TaxID=3073241 RepID=UPI002875ED62|nr:Sec-independent protein translocase protein TatB [Pusillimonas sp. SM2304]MDS1139953.1 Sec-independent protein translocase protein TatB [Pusillimonas sp. SM2304]
MFDVSFSELMLIGVIALIVIGPERLPKVARTIGHLVGRAQRYVSDVKTDIQREMDLDELNNLKGQMEEAAKSVKSSMQDATDSLRAPLDEAQQALKDASASVESLVDSAKAEASDNKQDKPQERIPEPLSEPPAEAAPPAADAPAAEQDTATLPLPGFDDTSKTKTGTPT